MTLLDFALVLLIIALVLLAASFIGLQIVGYIALRQLRKR